MKGRWFSGWLPAAALCVVALLYAALSFLTPPGLDDWAFMAEWRDIIGSRPLGLSSLFDFWSDIRLYDNGRFSNTLIPVFLLYSPWKEFFPFITGIAVALIILFIVRFSFADGKCTLFRLSIAWAAAVFFLPWRNALFIADYSINYIWTAAITMGFISYVLSCEKAGWSLWRLIFGLFWAFIAAGWHEGFALASEAGLLLYTLSSRSRRFSLQWWILGVFYGGVAVANYYCPGMLLRTERELGEGSIGMSLSSLLVDFAPVIITIVAIGFYAVVPSLRNGLRKAWQSPYFAIGAGVVVVGTLMSILFVHQPRSAFWPDIMAIVMFIILTRHIWIKIGESAYRNYVALIFLACSFIPTTFAIQQQYGLYLEGREIEAQMASSEIGVVYHDVDSPGRLSLLALKIPSYSLWHTAFNSQAWKRYTRKPYAAVVPTALSFREAYDNPESLSADGNYVKIGNHILYVGRLSEEAEVIPLSLTLKEGRHIELLVTAIPYLAPDNRPYTYLLPLTPIQ